MSNVQLAYEEYGDKANAPLIIIHGFFASSRNWRMIAKKLADDFHVYVVDMRNHGASPHHAVMDYPSMMDDLVLFMDQRNLVSANLLGHSMGGKVVMWFALNYPQRVMNLIIADISPESYQHSFNATIQALKDLPLAGISNRKQADEFLSSAIPEQSYRLFLLQNVQLVEGRYQWRVDLDIFYRQAHHIAAFPLLGSLKSSDDKVLFLMGGNSHYTNQQAIYHYFPQAEIAVLEGANHWLHVDDPIGFIKHTRAFLNSD